MKFTPVNRYIHIETVKEESQALTMTGIVLPDDFKPTEERYAIVKIKGWAEDVKFKNMFPISLSSLEYSQELTDVDYFRAMASFRYLYYEFETAT